MPRSVYQVQRIALVLHLDSVALDGDAALFLQVHVVQHLVLHVFLVHRAGHLQHTVRQGALPVVNMGNNTKVAYILHNLYVGQRIKDIG